MKKFFLKEIFDNIKKKKNNIEDYAFTEDEINSLNKQNNEKIKILRKDIIEKPKKELEIPNPNIELKKEVEEPLKEEINSEEELEIAKEIEEIIESHKEDEKISYINLSDELQKEISDAWQQINSNEIDKDILKGKEILNHNYTIYYADEAARFVHDIRKKYEIVINYLVGFNNEKKGMYNKTILSDLPDNEWKFLKQYISVLEKIRSFKK